MDPVSRLYFGDLFQESNPLVTVASMFRQTILATVVLVTVSCGGGFDRSSDSLPNAFVNSIDRLALDAQGFDVAVIEALAEHLAAGVSGPVDGFIIARRGEVVFEQYFNGFGPETLHRQYSATKSVTSLLIGIAIDQGEIPTIGVTLRSAFPQYPMLDNEDVRKDSITLQNMLRMRAGFEWDEWGTDMDSPQNPAVQLWESADWMKHMLDLPMSEDPGERFNYNSGVTMLLSDMIRYYTGLTAEAYAERHLFGPLGIRRWDWEAGPNAVTNTGWGLFLRPRDMLVIGEMVRNGGRHESVQVVPELWLTESLQMQDTDGYPTTRYGYQWWGFSAASEINNLTAQNDMYFAWGRGDQHIFVAPHLELTVVITSSDYDEEYPALPGIYDYVLPAVTSDTG